MTLTRRHLLKLALVTAASSQIGCSSPPPRPFIAGAEKPTPKGCKELLARDHRGDC